MRTALTALIAAAMLTAPAQPTGAEPLIRPYSADSNRPSVNPGAVLVGLITLGLIASALKDDDDPAPAPVYVEPPRKIHTVRPINPRPVVVHRPLPRHCLREIPRQGKTMRVYGRNCLSEAHYAVATLPASCSVTVRTRLGDVVGYRARCLRLQGYRMARR